MPRVSDRPITMSMQPEKSVYSWNVNARMPIQTPNPAYACGSAKTTAATLPQRSAITSFLNTPNSILCRPCVRFS